MRDRVFIETGLIIEHKSKNTLHEAKCDFIVNNNGEIHDFSDKREYKIDITYNKLPQLPVKLNSLRLTKTLINQGIIDISECKLNFHK